MHGEPVGLGEVHRRELDPGLHEVRDEGNTAGQTIQLGDDEDGAMEPTEPEGFRQARAVILLATLDLNHLC